MKQIFDKPQLKEGTYRAFIDPDGDVLVIANNPSNFEEVFTMTSRFMVGWSWKPMIGVSI